MSRKEGWPDTLILLGVQVDSRLCFKDALVDLGVTGG